MLQPVGVDVGTEDQSEYELFEKLLRMRHALACGLKLKPIIEAVERGVSHVSQIIRAESKGNISGRLDIQLYLNRRSTNMSWPRSFPVLVAADSPNTPENQLVGETLRQLGRRLSDSRTLRPSAERAYGLNLLRWTREKLHAVPWSRVTPVRSILRLRREAEHRLRKRQTGNEPAYMQFVSWHNQWLFDAGQSDPEQIEEFVNLLLAFPPGDFFDDKVFEVWCLHQVIEAFRRAGSVLLHEPRALFERTKRSICAMRYGNYHFDVWFQRALPTSHARWKYVSSMKPLVGIPDITVVGADGRRLILDAKRREVMTPTRAEETYKILGYFENFREIFTAVPFWAVLCFLSESELYTEVVADQRHKLFLVGANDVNPIVCAFGGRLDTVIAEWLSLREETSAQAAPLKVM